MTLSGSKPVVLDHLAVDLRRSVHLAPLARAFLRGERRDLLAPLRFIGPNDELRSRSEPDSAIRGRLAAALIASNRALGHPCADELGERLSRPETRVVVTGQQPGLFGGPLYSLSKMVAATRVAATLEERGQPAVAVFWMASEDHDFQEVAQAWMGPLGTISLGDDREPLRPVGQRVLGPGVSSLLAALGETASPPQKRWLDRLGRWYHPESTFTDAFGRLLIHLLGDRCPLLLDALDPVLKELERPHLRRLVERRVAASEAVDAANARVEAAGFPLQVRPREGASPLFVLHQGARRCVEWDGPETYRLRGLGDSAPVSELLALVEERPEVVSPGVLGRPVIQDAVLGTGLQLLGPGELSYMAQAAALYPVLEVEAPDTALRPQILLALPKECERLAWLARRGITLEDLLGEPGELERRLAAGAGPDRVRPVAMRIDALLEELHKPLVELEVQLERPWEKTREQVVRSLEMLASRADAAAARQDETLRSRAVRLRESLLPEGRLQERRLSTGWAVATFGEGLGHYLYAAMSLDSQYLQLLTPDSDPGGEEG